MITDTFHLFDTHYFQLRNGQKLFYQEAGKGSEILFFIHGLAGASIIWDKNMSELSMRYRCVAVDLPGNGLSDGPEDSYSLKKMANLLIEFISENFNQNVHILGHSMGGQLAMHLVHTAPKLIKSLSLIAPAGIETFSEWEKNIYKSTLSFMDIFSTLENSLRKSIRTSFYNDTTQGDELADRLIQQLNLMQQSEYRRMLDQCISAMLEEPVFEFIPEIDCPVLVCFGERDALIPNRMIHPTSTEMLATPVIKNFPNAELFMIPKAGHFVHWEKARLVNEIINDFIQKHSVATP